MKMSKKFSFLTIILKITAGKNTLMVPYASYSFMQISNLVKLFLTKKSFCKQSKMLAWGKQHISGHNYMSNFIFVLFKCSKLYHRIFQS